MRNKDKLHDLCLVFGDLIEKEKLTSDEVIVLCGVFMTDSIRNYYDHDFSDQEVDEILMDFVSTLLRQVYKMRQKRKEAQP